MTDSIIGDIIAAARDIPSADDLPASIAVHSDAAVKRMFGDIPSVTAGSPDALKFAGMLIHVDASAPDDVAIVRSATGKVLGRILIGR